MPLLKVKVRKLSADSVLSGARTSASIARELADIAQFPPARAAATIVLLIFETIEGMQNNKQGCRRLARRAAEILLDVRERMRGRWDRAPRSLTRNLAKLESTLNVIYEFMKREANANWRNRLMRKSTIEEALVDYNTLLDDAARSFQIGSLIDIHYTLHQVVSAPTMTQVSSPMPMRTTFYIAETTTIEVLNDPAPFAEPNPICSTDGERRDSPTSSVYLLHGEEETEELVSPEVLPEFDDRGFPRYNRSQVRLHAHEPHMAQDWWKDAAEVDVNGETALMKTYEGPDAIQHWLADVKMLQTVYHPNMPQLVGLSDDTTPVPFVLLTNVRTRIPEARVLDALRRGNLAFCAELVLRLYRDVSEAALYTQQEMGYSDTDLQDFVEKASYRIDEEANVVVGLPPPREGNWITFRSYGLTESLLGIALKMLPNSGRPVHLLKPDGDEMSLEMQRKLSHLAVFARALLPREKQSPKLSGEVEALITDEYDGRPTLPLRILRRAALDGAGGEGEPHCWRENQGVPAHKFAPGDLGYLPAGESLGTSFVRLCNVLEEGLVRPDEMPLIHDSFGNQWDWDDSASHRRHDMQKYDMPGGAACWPLGVLPGQQMDCQVEHTARLTKVAHGWRFLLEHGKALGARFGVLPEELILITSAANVQDFYITNGFKSHARSSAPFGGPHMNAFPGGPAMHSMGRFGMPGHQQNHGWGSLPMVPKIFYLFTSGEKGFEPYWSQTPMPVPPGAQRPQLDHGSSYKIGWCTGCVWYVMGYAEDFE